MKKIFIEGVCGVGKTMLVGELAKMLPAFVIPELPEFNRGLLKPFGSASNIIFNFKEYVKHESIRQFIFSYDNFDEINYAIMDRSYLSIVALGISMEDYIGANEVRGLISCIIERLNRNVFCCPDQIIVLDASYQTIYHRNMKKSKVMDDIWISFDRIKSQTIFYDYLVDKQIAVRVNNEFAKKDVLHRCKSICEKTINQSVYGKERLIDALREYQF